MRWYSESGRIELYASMSATGRGELAPLLNQRGRAAIASLVEDLRSLPPQPKA